MIYFVKVTGMFLHASSTLFLRINHGTTYSHKIHRKLMAKLTMKFTADLDKNVTATFYNKNDGAQPTQRPPSLALLRPVLQLPSPGGVREFADLPVPERFWGSAALVYPRGSYLRFPSCEKRTVYWIHKARPLLRQPRISVNL